MSETELLTESPRLKAAWLTDAMCRVPEGTRVRIVASDVSAYINQPGVVIGFDVGTDGDWPLVRIKLDNGTIDAFLCDGQDDDEIKED